MDAVEWWDSLNYHAVVLHRDDGVDDNIHSELSSKEMPTDLMQGR